MPEVTGDASKLNGNGFTQTPQGGTGRPTDKRRGIGKITGSKFLIAAMGLIGVNATRGSGLPHDGGKTSKGPQRK